MFQFPSFPLYGYVLAIQWQRFALPGFPIRISTDHSLFATPRSFSQLITSFFGAWCQGIHHTLLLAWSLLFPKFLHLVTFSVLGFFLDHSFKFLQDYIKLVFFTAKIVLCLIHNTLLFYSYNIICYLFRYSVVNVRLLLEYKKSIHDISSCYKCYIRMPVVFS